VTIADGWEDPASAKPDGGRGREVRVRHLPRLGVRNPVRARPELERWRDRAFRSAQVQAEVRPRHAAPRRRAPRRVRGGHGEGVGGRAERNLGPGLERERVALQVPATERPHQAGVLGPERLALAHLEERVPHAPRPVSISNHASHARTAQSSG
jgi:hypothetical protein